jgi:hypothetical protein
VLRRLAVVAVIWATVLVVAFTTGLFDTTEIFFLGVLLGAAWVSAGLLVIRDRYAPALMEGDRGRDNRAAVVLVTFCGALLLASLGIALVHALS